MRNDNAIYYQDPSSYKMVRTRNRVQTSAERTNFVITCRYGDWSGFRTLAECECQFNELESRFGEYAVVER